MSVSTRVYSATMPEHLLSEGRKLLLIWIISSCMENTWADFITTIETLIALKMPSKAKKNAKLVHSLNQNYLEVSQSLENSGEKTSFHDKIRAASSHLRENNGRDLFKVISKVLEYMKGVQPDVSAMPLQSSNVDNHPAMTDTAGSVKNQAPTEFTPDNCITEPGNVDVGVVGNDEEQNSTSDNLSSSSTYQSTPPSANKRKPEGPSDPDTDLKKAKIELSGRDADEEVDENDDIKTELDGISNGDRKKLIDIWKLEKALDKLHHEIQKEERRELSIDDLDSGQSSYFYLSKLKNKAYGIFKQMQELKCEKVSTFRKQYQRIVFTGLYPTKLNEELSTLINKSIDAPDYPDVHSVVKSFFNRNGKGNENVDKIAQQVFKKIMHLFSKRRLIDLNDVFQSEALSIELQSEDPAESDEELRKKLEANRRLVPTEAEIFNQYTAAHNFVMVVSNVPVSATESDLKEVFPESFKIVKQSKSRFLVFFQEENKLSKALTASSTSPFKLCDAVLKLERGENTADANLDDSIETSDSVNESECSRSEEEEEYENIEMEEVSNVEVFADDGDDEQHRGEFPVSEPTESVDKTKDSNFHSKSESTKVEIIDLIDSDEERDNNVHHSCDKEDDDDLIVLN